MSNVERRMSNAQRLRRRPPAPSVSGVVLAAGISRRFGGEAKQLLAFDGEALVHRAARVARSSRLGEVLVVVGYRRDEVAAAVADLAVAVVVNPDFEQGQSSSVRAGLAATDPGAAAVLFLPCDQPFLTAEVLDRLVAAYATTGGPIVVPAFAGRRGAPGLFDRSLFPELAALRGDVGGRQVIAAHPQAVVEVPLADEWPLLDVDEPGDLVALHRGHHPRS
jgi:molybdenum cofactor cytidylyltransferase